MRSKRRRCLACGFVGRVRVDVLAMPSRRWLDIDVDDAVALLDESTPCPICDEPMLAVALTRRERRRQARGASVAGRGDRHLTRCW